MQTLVRKKNHRACRRGGITVLTALLLPVAFLLAAFVINFSWIKLARTQVFISADAAARAGGRTYAMTGDLNEAKTKARAIAKLNAVAGSEITLSDSDFVLGVSSRTGSSGRYKFTAGGANPNALQITIRRTLTSSNGAVPMIFPGFLDVTKYEFEKTSISTRVEVDIAFVVDRSGSMIYAVDEVATGYPPKSNPNWKQYDPVPPNSRWLGLVNAANGFISEMNKSVLDEYVSLTSYGTDVSMESELTSNYDSITSGLNKFTTSLPPGKTNIGDGLQQGLNSFTGANSRKSASKVVILMTDGKLNAPAGAKDPVTVAKAAAKDGVVIFTITFANEADQALMQQVASAGSGKHFHASSASSLTEVLQTIVRMLPTVLTQ